MKSFIVLIAYEPIFSTLLIKEKNEKTEKENGESH